MTHPGTQDPERRRGHEHHLTYVLNNFRETGSKEEHEHLETEEFPAKRAKSTTAEAVQVEDLKNKVKELADKKLWRATDW